MVVCFFGIFFYFSSSSCFVFLRIGLLLLINPLYCYNLSFIYSFLISFGLIFLLNRKTNVFYLSLFCFFLILPVSASTSYKINFFSIITNLWSILYVSFILYPLALLVFFLPFMLFVFEFFLKIFLFFQQVSLSLAIVFVIPKVSWLLWLLYYYLFYKSLNCKYYWFWLCLLLLFFHYGFKNSNVLVSFISVGQGDCTLLVSPYQREVYLIDVGGNVSDDNYLATNIVTYLNSMGISKVDGLILTHGDYDHAGNTLALISKIPVKKIYINHNSLNDVETSISKVRDVLMFKNLDGFFQIHNLNLSKDSDENNSFLRASSRIFCTACFTELANLSSIFRAARSTAG